MTPNTTDVMALLTRLWRGVRQITHGRLVGLAVALPTLIRTKRTLATTPDLRDLVSTFDKPAQYRRLAPSTDDLEWGLRAALELIGPRTDACVPRGLAMFAMLSERGQPAVFVSGVRRTGDGLDGHAWVIAEGRLFGVGSETYVENFRQANRHVDA